MVTEAAEVVWELAREAPELVAHAPGGPASLGTLTPPAPPPSLAPFRDGDLVRPPGHLRAVYRLLPGAVLAWKGTEPTHPDFGRWAEEMSRLYVHVETLSGTPTRDVVHARSELRAIDKWPVLEGKVPGGYTVAEGLEEARAAAAFQRVHLARHGTLARVPLPLVVVRWPDAVQARVRALLAPLVSPRARPIVDAAELGALAYAYPTLPLRLYHLQLREAQAGFGLRARLAAFPPAIEPRVVAERWIELVGRMLACGFVPKAPTAVLTGDCLQMQNVVLDGGLADLGGLVPASSLDDRLLADSLRRTATELETSILRLLLGTAVPTPAIRDRFPDLLAHVWRALAAAVGKDPHADPRVLELLEPPSAWAGLERALALIFP